MKKQEAIYLANEIIAAIVTTITSDEEYNRYRELAERDNMTLRDWLSNKALDQVQSLEACACERVWDEE